MDNDRRYLQALIDEGEHQQQDFKYKVTDAVKLARSVSAFANTDGGRLLIGAAYKYCTPPSAISFETLHADGRTVVIATIPQSNHRPVRAIGSSPSPRAYIRIADENIVASPVHLEMWRQESSSVGTITTYSDDERAVMETLSTSTALPLNRIVRLSHVQRRKVVTILAKLLRFSLVAIDYHDEQFLFSGK